MMTFLKIVAFAACISLSYQDQLKITLFYETLCPDCQYFVTQQLYPAYKKIGDSLKIDLVPYGFASEKKIDGKWHFHCQHGTVECHRNKVDACSLSVSVDQDKHMRFINCIELQNINASDEDLAKCGDEAGINWDSINACLTNGTGDALLIGYGKRTKSTRPRVQFVPMLFFNDVYNSTLQKRAEVNFLATACSLLDFKPSGCSKYLNVQNIPNAIVPFKKVFSEK